MTTATRGIPMIAEYDLPTVDLLPSTRQPGGSTPTAPCCSFTICSAIFWSHFRFPCARRWCATSPPSVIAAWRRVSRSPTQRNPAA